MSQTYSGGGRRLRQSTKKKRSGGGWKVLLVVLCLAILAVGGWMFLQNRQFLGIAPTPTPTPTSSQAITETAEPTALPAETPSPTAEETAQPADTATSSTEEDWRLILVNKWNPIPEDYELELTQLSNGQSVDSRIYPELQAMFDAARASGVYPVVASGYRTAEKQQSLMDEKIAALVAEGYSEDDAKTEAEQWVAIPGTSEHQLGLCVDINADGIHSAGYEVYDWLEEHAHEYGFILRFPADKTEITGVSNEPWHYRYVGVEYATEIWQQGVCLEEYLGRTEH